MNMTKTCKICGTAFEITDQDITIYKKLDVPFPTLCPEDRHKRKMAFRNERFLYKRACNLCNKEVVSIYSHETDFPVFCNACWWSDKWDPLKFGVDFDFSKSFFEQFSTLIKNVPKCALDNFDQENAEYCNFSCHNKNCYMLFGSWFNEKSMYGHSILHGLEINDSLYSNKCRYGYELIDCEECYELFYAQNCTSCSQSYFLFDCRNCQNCIFSCNLRGKQYHIFNKQVSKDEYERTVKSFLGSNEKTKAAFNRYRKLVENEAIHKYMAGEQNENSSGNFLYQCKNANDVFYGLEVENVTHSLRTSKKQKDSMDIYGNSGGELMYDSMHCDFCYRGKFDFAGEHNTELIYCWYCYSSENCFGSIGLRHKKYCILNKEYSREEYFSLLPRIIEYMGQEWGEFFPQALSPFAYNETVAQEYYPISEEEAESRGLKWLSESSQNRAPQTFLIPDHITDVSERILSEVLACESCGKNFKIVNQELEFYKKYSLPISLRCFSCRYLERLSFRPPYKTFSRNCSKCNTSIRSSYSPDRPETVYCEKCYLEAVY